MSTIRIGDREIGSHVPPFIVAEMSANHGQSIDRALAIVDAAADAGAHAIKLQTYTADTMTLNIKEGDFRIQEEDSLWHGRSLYDLYEEAHTPWDWHQRIFERANERDLTAFSTPFDGTAIDFLEELDVPAYKIASFEAIDLQLIQKAAGKRKPLIISTGMATVAELEDAVRAARSVGCEELILLQCTSTYPASPEGCDLRTIPHMRDLFGVQVGLSDHTPGVGVALASVALGATLIEKHFTLSRAHGGVDAAFSLEPDELRLLVRETNRAWRSLGSIRYGPTDQETKSLRFRRSLYVIQDLAAGDALTEDNVRAIRPGFGLAPKELRRVLGLRVKCAVARGTPLGWNLVV